MCLIFNSLSIGLNSLTFPLLLFSQGLVGIISAFNFPVAVYGWNNALAMVSKTPKFAAHLKI